MQTTVNTTNMQTLKIKNSNQLRLLLAQEAARLMFDEGVNQYFDAKRLAAKRLLGRVGGRKLRYRPQDLPSNGEIQSALLEIAELEEGDGRQERLFVMRIAALETMQSLLSFDPCLIGSVSTGHIRKDSDIDLHVFTDNIEELTMTLDGLGWQYATKMVMIRKSNEISEYTHVHMNRGFPVELSVYPMQERRNRQRSSTDGKPIIRVKPKALMQCLEKEHAQLWQNYLNDKNVDVGIE